MDLVTGGSGYFGCLLVGMLRQQGRSVRVFDINDADDRPAGVEFQLGDIRDAAAVAKACSGAERVFHCVAQVPLAKDRKLFHSVNRDGTANLLQAARSAGARKVIYVSSSAVYGVPRRNPVRESDVPRPMEEYGLAKLEGETLCRRAADAGLDCSIIRPRTIMGHGRLGIMQMIFEWVHGGRNVYVLGDGSNRYQFVHADDLADACLRAADRPGFEAYNIGAAEFDTMRRTLEGLVAHAGTGSRVVGLPAAPAVAAMQFTGRMGLSPLAPYHWIMYGKEMFFDLAKPRAELGWQPRWSNTAMFAQSYDWYVAHRDRILAEKQARSKHRSAVKEGILNLLKWW